MKRADWQTKFGFSRERSRENAMFQVINMVDDIKSRVSRQRDLCLPVTLDIKNAFHSRTAPHGPEYWQN